MLPSFLVSNTIGATHLDVDGPMTSASRMRPILDFSYSRCRMRPNGVAGTLLLCRL